MCEHVLEVTDLCVDYKEKTGIVHAVSHVSFTADAGEIIGLIGPSGSGKSTAVKALTGVLSYNAVMTDGEILYKGRSLTGRGFTDVRSHQKYLNSIRGKEIAVLFQNPKEYLDPTMKIKDQIMEALSAHEKVPLLQRTRRCAEVLRSAGIDDTSLLDRIPAQLSGGQAQRIAAAMALVHGPSLLIADEPFASLDSESRNALTDLFRRRCRENGMTVLLVSHDMDAVVSLCERAYVFCDGEIAEEGSVTQLLRNPQKECTKQLAESYFIMKGEI